MKTQGKFWWFVAVAVSFTFLVLCTIAVLFWQQLTTDQKQILLAILKEDFAFFFTAVVLLFTAFGFTLDWFFRFYIIPVNQLADETNLIVTVNPSHRIQVSGSYDVMRLADIVNRTADRQEAFRRTVENQLQRAEAETRKEKDILATLLENLPHGILVCNLDGSIVFYNRKVKSLLTQHQMISPNGRHPDGPWIGLGRSVNAFVDKGLINLALDRISQKLGQGFFSVTERFLLGTQGKNLLPAEIIPVLDSQHHLTGFIIYFEDQSEKMIKEKEVTERLQAWQYQLTQSISVIKATSEILKDEQFKLDPDSRQLIQILDEKAGTAAELLTRNDIMAEWAPRQLCPLTLVDAAEWIQFFFQGVEKAVGLKIKCEDPGIKTQISIDVHHLTSALVYVFSKLTDALRMENHGARMLQKEDWVYLDCYWQGDSVSNSLLKQLKQSAPKTAEKVAALSVEDTLNVHSAKLWPNYHLLPKGFTGLRLLLPSIEKSEVVSVDGRITVLPESRPEFYDFNLFQQAGQNPELDKRYLTDLTFTVFDTETTGLDPQGGDEIISIGAVRIVNGRLLREDHFEQLIDPRRSLPWASVKYHGIRPEMLKNQPFIEQVLPLFYEFACDTILLGHNVAFDMRMLQLKEEQCGIVFDNPVLDTMLLSAIVHPAHPKHTISAIADRLGVSIVGRHTALGDAIATGEIFLKLLPLLAEMGIRTLQQARQMSEKTFYARLKY